YDCPAVLLVICPDPATGRWARQPIPTGHPGFNLVPLVSDRTSVPAPDTPGLPSAAPELAVLGALTGAIDLTDDTSRHLLLATIAAAALDEDRLETYTHLILATAPAAARTALETLMTTVFKDEFIDRIKAEGHAEGHAEGRTAGAGDLVLRILAARGFTIPDPLRDRVRTCDNLAQLETWGIRAVDATTLDDIFRD
ncbi:MAG TPA: hypothetical protein VF834_09160, partial [Streptosporangiaceae bacterium]